MTRLYTKLVTYGRLYILTLVVSFYHDVSYILFIPLFFTLIILLSFISVIMLLLLTLLYARAYFSLHTLTRSLLTTLDSYVQGFGHLPILFRCSLRSYACKEVELPSVWFCYSYLFYSCFCTFPDSCLSDSVAIPILFIWYHVWMLICDIAVIVDLLWFKFIDCSGRLSVYTWGIFLAYIRRRLSSRFCFHVFWEAGRDRVFFSIRARFNIKRESSSNL